MSEHQGQLTVDVFGDATQLISEMKRGMKSLDDFAKSALKTGREVGNGFGAGVSRIAKNMEGVAKAVYDADASIRKAAAETSAFLEREFSRQARSRADHAFKMKADAATEADAQAKMNDRMLANEREFEANKKALQEKALAERERVRQRGEAALAVAARESRIEAVRTEAKYQAELRVVTAEGLNAVKVLTEKYRTEQLAEELAYARELAAIAEREAAEAEKAERKRLGLRRSGSSTWDMRSAGDSMRQSGENDLAVLGGLAAGVASYDQAITQAANNTLATDEQVKSLGDNVAKVARVSSKPIADIANAFKNVGDQGYYGAQAMALVTAANEAAVSTNANLSDTAKGLATVMHQFNITVEDTPRALNVLEAVAAKNNTTLEEFVKAAGRGLAAASALGVPITEAASAMATLTRNGYSSAQATTAVRSIFTDIVRPSRQTEAVLKSLSKTTGVDLVNAFSAAGLRSLGLIGVFDRAYKATHGNADQMKYLFGNMRSGIPVLSLLTTRHQDLVDTLAIADQAWQENSRVQHNYQRSTQNLDYIIGNLRNRLQLLAKSFDGEVKPALSDVIHLSERLTDWLSHLSDGQKRLIVDGLAFAGVAKILVGSLLSLIGRAIQLRVALLDAAKTFGLVKTAAAAAGTEAEVAAAATAGAWALTGGAALAVVAFAGYCVYWWKQIKGAQDDAAASAKAYADKLQALKASGERGALIANRNEIAQHRAVFQDRVDAQTAQQALIAAAKKRGDLAGAANLQTEMVQNPDKFGDTSPGGLSRMKKIVSDDDMNSAAESLRLNQINATGAGGANRALLAVGGDGFAKSVIGHVFDDISLPTNIATCARFVEEVFARAGANIKPGTLDRAGDLVMWAAQHGAKKHLSMKDAMPGDLVSFTGPRYGAHGSGHHVGVYLGNGMMRDSPHSGVVRTESVNGTLKAMGGRAAFYTVPGSTFANAPSTPPRPQGGPINPGGDPSQKTPAPWSPVLAPLGRDFSAGAIGGSGGASPLRRALKAIEDGADRARLALTASSAGLSAFTLHVLRLDSRLSESEAERKAANDALYLSSKRLAMAQDEQARTHKAALAGQTARDAALSHLNAVGPKGDRVATASARTAYRESQRRFEELSRAATDADRRVASLTARQAEAKDAVGRFSEALAAQTEEMKRLSEQSHKTEAAFFGKQDKAADKQRRDFLTRMTRQVKGVGAGMAGGVTSLLGPMLDNYKYESGYGAFAAKAELARRSLATMGQYYKMDRQAFDAALDQQQEDVRARLAQAEQDNSKGGIRARAVLTGELQQEDALRARMHAKWTRDDEKQAKSLAHAWTEALARIKQGLASGLANLIVEGKGSVGDIIKTLLKNTVESLLENVIGGLLDKLGGLFHRPEDKQNEAAKLQDKAADKQLEAATKMTQAGTGPGGTGEGTAGAVKTAEHVASGIGGMLGNMGSVISSLGSLSTGKNNPIAQLFGASGAAKVSSAIGGISKVVSAVMPWVGIASLAAPLLGGLFHHSYNMPSSQGSIATGLMTGRDYSGAIDSGYSGQDGLRALMGQGKGVGGPVTNVYGDTHLHVAPGAVVAQGVQDAKALSDQFLTHVQDKLARSVALRNAGAGRI